MFTTHNGGMDMLIFMTLFGVGCLLGLTGGGGAGVVIAVLTAVFNVPIHLAMGTSLGAMSFTTLSGAVSHFREGNVNLYTGIALGVFGAVGAFVGAKFASLIPAATLHYLTGGMLILSTILMYLRLYQPGIPLFSYTPTEKLVSPLQFWLMAAPAGFALGCLSGTFGIGATPFIQLVLLILFRLPILIAVGTTMLVIFPIAVFGGFGYLLEGNLDAILFLQVVAGLMTGAYIGARFTKRIPHPILKFVMTIIPGIGAVVLFTGG
ncbi:sulfite exporter TauE/SafE family protein [Megasphaera massiliensis]|uniref:sulfite exporter TauE/SafE family protein n=1 Tax=Megasphaera massiliensis TaxID=1232428 RepID=UPI004027FA12